MNEAAILTVPMQAQNRVQINDLIWQKKRRRRKDHIATCNLSPAMIPSVSAEQHNQIVEMLEELSIPVAYNCFEGVMPEAPYLLFAMPDRGVIPWETNGILVSLYQKEYQEELETRLQRVLQRNHYDIKSIRQHQAEGLHHTEYLLTCKNEPLLEDNCFGEASSWS